MSDRIDNIIHTMKEKDFISASTPDLVVGRIDSNFRLLKDKVQVLLKP